MSTPRVTGAMHIRALMDEAVTVSQLAAAWDLDVYAIHTTEFGVEAHVGNVDHAQRLAAVLNLTRSQVYEHVHGTQRQIHTRWSHPSSPLTVVCVSKAERVGRVA